MNATQTNMEEHEGDTECSYSVIQLFAQKVQIKDEDFTLGRHGGAVDTTGTSQ